MENKLSDEEMSILNLLGQAFSQFIHLPKGHNSDAREFEHAIHYAQNIVLSRLAGRTCAGQLGYPQTELEKAQEWYNSLGALESMDIGMKYKNWDGKGFTNEELISWYKTENKNA